MGLDFAGTSRFEVITRLGEGAMGVVYQAVDRESNSRVAVKTLRDLDAGGLLRFKNEFRSIQGLQHPNLVSLGELIETDGHWFFTMELVEGVDFYSYVRPRRSGGRTEFCDEPTAPTGAWIRQERHFDEKRLRSALAQLGAGLSALHHAGFVHRDIKPSNILVAHDGRVVVLDFGFVIGVAQHSSDRIVGTAAYMAPEQAASLPVGPEADWYSVGAVLYEALTGSPPIDGMPLEVLMQKQHRIPAAPSTLAENVPPDLDELCMQLLAIRPLDRPREDELLRRLGSDSELPTPAPSSSIDLLRRFFVGREDELGVLDAAYRESRDQGATAIYVHGESGIGKSTLVGQFLGDLAETERDLLVLESRCYERESVPYKAFDGIVDALAGHLVDLDPVSAAMLLPLHITTLSEVFPVLRQAEVVARAMRPSREERDPAEQRSRMFAALRDLFTRLASARPVVVAIDDFQWADEDSLALLQALFRGPDAPPLLLVATIRDGSQRRPGPLRSVGIDAGLERTHHLRLRGLPSEHATRLARHLLAQVAPALAEHAGAIVDESDGHPLFIDEMIRYGAMIGSAPASLHLDSALWARVLGIEEPARAILELVAVSDTPLRKGVAASAARMGFEEFSRWTTSLRIANLIQTTGARKDDQIGVFHDRVRRAVIHNLDVERRRSCHERLALAMETSGAGNAEALAIHWSGAGNEDRAYDYLVIAAEQAERALAFERAARLYRRCIDVLAAGSSESVRLRARLGDALANAGRSAEAANVYLSAAQDGGERSVELFARAASQFIRSGHVDSGFEVLRSSLAKLGVGVPATPRRALASLLSTRGRLRVRGLRFRERSESEISERELSRLDTTWGLAVGLGLIDTIRGAEIQGRHLLLALEAGEPNRVARALAVEGAYRLSRGRSGEKGARDVFSRATSLARRLERPELDATISLMTGIGEFCLGNYASAERRCASADELFRDRCYGVRWERSTAQIIAFWSQWYQGKLSAMIAELPLRLREARERGDLYAATSFQSVFRPLVRLAKDRPDRARQGDEVALRRWSQRGFHLQHYCHLYAQTLADVYAGEPAIAVARLDEQWPALRRSLLLSVQQSRIEAMHARAAAELALARQRGGDRALSARVKRVARDIHREQCPWADGLAMLLDAGRSSLAGDDDAAARELAAAAPVLRQAGLVLFAAAADRRRGRVLGGDEGATLVADADAVFRGESIASPARMAAMLAPGFTD